MKRILIILFLIGIIIFPAYAVNIYVGTTNDSTQFMIIDYNGKKTGYDPQVKREVFETNFIIMYYVWNPYNPYIPQQGQPNPQYMMQGEFPVDMVPLNMKLILTGMKMASNPMTIEFIEYNSNLPYPQNSRATVISPILDINQTAVYDITYVPVQSLTVTKVATPIDLVNDIQTLSKLSYIGNTHFVSELVKEINEIEAEKAKGKVDDGLTPAQKAKKEYSELLNEITEKYNKPESDEFVKQEAYTVLREDLEYIISHL